MESRTCWICLRTDSTDDKEEDEILGRSSSDEWIRPCHCRGSIKWVHSKCFYKYVMNQTKSKLRCIFCQTRYNIIIRDFLFIHIFEFLNSFFMNVILAFSFLFLVISLYLILFVYGLSVMLAATGLDTTKSLFYKVENDVFLFDYIGIARALLGIPLLPLSILYSNFKTYSFLSHIIPVIIIIDIPKLSISNVLFSSLPILYFLYRVVINYIKEKVSDTSDGSRHDEDSRTEIIFNDFNIPVKDVGIALLTPYVAAIVGFSVRRKASYSGTLLGGAMVTFAVDFCNILYRYFIKKRAEGLRVIEPVLDSEE
ncbi:hypothetical protein VCUG_01059 [Vavraia culicis subsp. floridensis]|uniref:RING-CH-type domain-containing protein n=1 Tax=Vavraia culicis (isolate floridensis) TaxID=948595 RepID=L2GVW0_VAVCU|nr:uncharacterized protein VCUG_01059 [Vavraia culicis subsp. floridensis]ELA47408.1 hypothetical protein VCUG_01059 [Vavraia culicis subsp. floridensis]